MQALHAKPRWASSRRARIAALVVSLLVVCGAAWPFLWKLLDAERGAPPNVYLLNFSPVRQPAVVSAEEAGLKDDDEVIGVSAEGRHRAYLLSALLPLGGHVVNDLVGEVPVTVAYCDRSDCTKVFTSPSGAPAHNMTVGGWDNRFGGQALLLRIGFSRYRQDNQELVAGDVKPFPYAPSDFVRTTWGRWRQEHPDTDVYLGKRTLPHRPEVPGN